MQKDRNGNSNEDSHISENSRHDHHDNIRERDLHIDRDVSGKDMVEENRSARHHGQEYGNRKYESYRNHSSADDQPMNDSGA